MSSKHYQGFGTKENVIDSTDTIDVSGDQCPECYAGLKKEYNFDKFGDVQLQTFDCGCKKFTVTKFDGFDMWVCDSYREAEGVARLTKMSIDDRYGALG